MRDLVERAQRGDTEAFEALARMSSDRLYSIAFRITRDSERARDALQAALISIWDDLPSLRDPERFDAWACRVVVRASHEEIRSDRRWQQRVRVISNEASDAAPDEIRSVADRDQLERAFRRLSSDQRAVVVLRHYLGLPLTEIAETLGIPLGTATSRLHYAVRALRAAVEADSRVTVLREGRSA